jgi:hypothetical protein
VSEAESRGILDLLYAHLRRPDRTPGWDNAVMSAQGDGPAYAVAELLGLSLDIRTGGLRFLRHPATGDWAVDIPPIHRVPTTAEQVRAFALACGACLAAGPGEHDADVFDDGADSGVLGLDVGADGSLDLQLVMNLSGAVSMHGSGYDRTRVQRLVEALLAATAPPAL